MGSPLTALVRKSVLSFGSELKEGSEKGVKDSREEKLSHPCMVVEQPVCGVLVPEQ